ncbi:hypothetical protein ACJX0J_042499 [Zea mays]
MDLRNKSLSTFYKDISIPMIAHYPIPINFASHKFKALSFKEPPFSKKDFSNSGLIVLRMFFFILRISEAVDFFLLRVLLLFIHHLTFRVHLGLLTRIERAATANTSTTIVAGRGLIA